MVPGLLFAPIFDQLDGNNNEAIAQLLSKYIGSIRPVDHMRVGLLIVINYVERSRPTLLHGYNEF